MGSTIAGLFTSYAANKLNQLVSRMEDCLGRLTDEQIWARGAETENAIGNLVIHLNGNVRQWILVGVGGQPGGRERDAEFAARGGLSRDQLLVPLKQTLAEAAALIATLDEARLGEAIVVQDYPVTVLEAVFHVVEHFAQHTAQILYATKMLTGEDLGFYRHLNRPRHGERTP